MFRDVKEYSMFPVLSTAHERIKFAFMVFLGKFLSSDTFFQTSTPCTTKYFIVLQTPEKAFACLTFLAGILSTKKKDEDYCKK